jgi:hypothetical protein
MADGPIDMRMDPGAALSAEEVRTAAAAAAAAAQATSSSSTQMAWLVLFLRLATSSSWLTHTVDT